MITVINCSGRLSKLGGIVNLVELTDDSPVYHAPGVHLSRAKSSKRINNRYAEAKFSKSGVWDNVPDGSTLIFEVSRISC